MQLVLNAFYDHKHKEKNKSLIHTIIGFNWCLSCKIALDRAHPVLRAQTVKCKINQNYNKIIKRNK